jgi:MFS family permease
MALVGIASGFAGVPAAAILADVVPKERSATGVAIYRFAGDLGFTLGPLAAGFAATGLGFEAAFAVVAVPTLIAMVFALRSPETLRRAEATVETVSGSGGPTLPPGGLAKRMCTSYTTAGAEPSMHMAVPTPAVRRIPRTADTRRSGAPM